MLFAILHDGISQTVRYARAIQKFTQVIISLQIESKHYDNLLHFTKNLQVPAAQFPIILAIALSKKLWK